MAYWNGKEIVYLPPQDCDCYPGWEEIDCGCCAGLKWGSESPTECPYCIVGIIYRHKESGALAEYPGGPFLGRDVQRINKT